MRIKNKKKILSSLYEVADRLNGEHSGIPQCCVDVYVAGRTYYSYSKSLSPEDKIKLKKWEYVPCDKCFKHVTIRPLLRNGSHPRTAKVISLIKEIKNDR